MAFRNRIIETRMMKPSEIKANPKNWRLHPDDQKDAARGILTQVGIVDALIAYKSDRAGGELVFIDGHLRRDLDEDTLWPVQILDLNDAEADLILATFDPLSAMAGMDAEKMNTLQETVQSDDFAVRELLRDLEKQARENGEDEAIAKNSKKDDGRGEGGPPEMELLPFEHYDYVVLFFRHQLDFAAALDTLELRREVDPRKTGKIGLSRVMDGAKFVELLKAAKGNKQVSTEGM